VGVSAPRNRILLVEDDPDVRPLLEHVLMSTGYKVDSAGTLAEGRQLFERNTYDLVLADVELPDGSGISLADEAKAKGVNALIITGYAFRIPQSELARHEYIMKPSRPRELLAAVARHLAPTKTP
jgi:DNA-binding response OmpR family regulator